MLHLNEMLQTFYSPTGNERLGFLIQDKQVELIEVRNISTAPTETFIAPTAALIEWEDKILATWHTHPDGVNEPSIYDKQAFVNYPDVVHYIIGSNGIAAYAIEGGKVVPASAEKTDHLARLVAEVFQGSA